MLLNLNLRTGITTSGCLLVGSAYDIRLLIKKKKNCGHIIEYFKKIVRLAKFLRKATDHEFNSRGNTFTLGLDKGRVQCHLKKSCSDITHLHYQSMYILMYANCQEFSQVGSNQ